MLIVAPTGRTNRAICLSTLQFSSKHFIVMGSVAELWKRVGCLTLTRSMHVLRSILFNGVGTSYLQIFWGVHVILTWMMWLGQWPWLAKAPWCMWKDFSVSEWNRRMEARWGHAQTGLQGPSPRTSLASSQEWRGRSCPGFCQPQERWSQKENTCWKMQRRI